MMNVKFSDDMQVNLRRGSKVVGAFAVVGFAVPLLLLVFYRIAHKMGSHPSTMPLLYLCPSSIAAMGLDNASAIMGIFGWLVISLSNAVLYAIPGMAVGIVVSLGRSD